MTKTKGKSAIFTKSVAALLLMGQITSLPLAQANSLSVQRKNTERANYQSLKKLAAAFNTAADQFEKTGPQAFLDKLPERAFATDEEKYLLRDLQRTSRLPRLEVTATEFIFIHNQSRFATNLQEVANGVFVVDGRRYQYNFSLSVIDNLDAWKAQSKSQKQSAFLRMLDSMFLPRAQALTPMMGMVIFGLIGGLAGWWLGKTMKESREKKERAHEQKLADAREAAAAERAARQPPPSVTNVLVPDTKAEGKADGKETKKGEGQAADPQQAKSETPAPSEQDKTELLKIIDKYPGPLKQVDGKDLVKDGKKVPLFTRDEILTFITAAKDPNFDENNANNASVLQNYRTYAAYILGRFNQLSQNDRQTDQISSRIANMIFKSRLTDDLKAQLEKVREKHKIPADI